MASTFRAYQSFLARKPLLGNVLTCGVSPSFEPLQRCQAEEALTPRLYSLPEMVSPSRFPYPVI